MGKEKPLASARGLVWRSRQESNLYLPLRRRPFYPLNYGSNNLDIVLSGVTLYRCFCQLNQCLFGGRVMQCCQ